MDGNETEQKKRIVLKVSHVFLLFFIAVLILFFLFRYRLKAQINGRIKEISDTGFPVTCEELDRWYSIPDDVNNAADVLLQAFSFYRKWNDAKLKTLPIGRPKSLADPYTEETKNLITQYLAENQKALELLHKGARIEHCRYPMDLSRGMALLAPHLADIRNGVRLLQLEAFLNAENNQTDLAIKSIESMLGLAHSLSKEPSLISQLVNGACRNLAVMSVGRLLNRAEFTDLQLRQLDKIFSDAQSTSMLSPALIGERCFGLTIFKMPVSELRAFVDAGSPARSVINPVIIAIYRLTGLKDMDTIIYLDLMSEHIKACELPVHKRQKAFKNLEAKLSSLSEIHILPRCVMPALSKCAIYDIQNVAEILALRTGIAIQRYRLHSGFCPENLSDLVPDYLEDIPKDPFHNNSLRYKKLDSGFVVYSIGVNGIDDGAKGKDSADKSSGDDISFTVSK